VTERIFYVTVEGNPEETNPIKSYRTTGYFEDPDVVLKVINEIADDIRRQRPGSIVVEDLEDNSDGIIDEEEDEDLDGFYRTFVVRNAETWAGKIRAICVDSYGKTLH